MGISSWARECKRLLGPQDTLRRYYEYSMDFHISIVRSEWLAYETLVWEEYASTSVMFSRLNADCVEADTCICSSMDSGGPSEWHLASPLHQP